MRRRIVACWVLWLLVCGCRSGPLSQPGPLLPAHGPLRVILLRGFRDWYSTGVDRLAEELRQHRVDATAFAESQAGELGRSLPSDLPRPLVLIGFSYGADDVIALARALDARGRPVALLITIDPVMPAVVPSNVSQCVNYYQSNGVWDVLPFLRGVALKRSAADDQPLSNINLRTTPSLLVARTSHATIAANPKVHEAVVSQVLATAERLR